MANDNGKDLSWKEQKRRIKLERKQDKQARKRARKEQKAARKLARQQQRNVVACRSLVERSQATQLIEELLSGLKAGKISIEHGAEQLMITPPEAVDLRVRGRQTHKSESLTIRVRWPRPAVTEETPNLKVSPT